MPTKMIFFHPFCFALNAIFLPFCCVPSFGPLTKLKKKKCCCRLHFVCYSISFFFHFFLELFVLCTCIFHHVQLLSARKGVHVLATPTHQEAAAGAGNPADDDHDDQTGSGNGIGIGIANGMAMKRAMSELGVWPIKRWHSTAQPSTEPAASTCWISR